MRFLRFDDAGRVGLAAAQAGSDVFKGFLQGEPGCPSDLTPALLGAMTLDALGAQLAQGQPVDTGRVRRLPPVAQLRKIICIGLNYVDHASEAGRVVPDYPTVFARFESSLIGDGAPLVRPHQSGDFDYEGELVAVIGRGGRHIDKAHALDHVCAYSVFNDGSLRDYQKRTPQWTVGKNFDGTGAFGPWLVAASALPPGARGLRLQTRLNGAVVQDAGIDDMVFDVATLVATLSATMTLEPGDVIVTGTPSGVGMARKPPLWMKPGDVCEVDISGIGVLRNPVTAEA